MSFPESNEPPFDHTENEHAAQNEQAAQKDQILKQILTPEARMRLNNIRMVKKELSDLVEQYLIGMATQGKMPGQINDDQLKQILLSIQQPKRDFKINRV
jgi:programmed cell death protein 5